MTLPCSPTLYQRSAIFETSGYSKEGRDKIVEVVETEWTKSLLAIIIKGPWVY